MARKEDSITPLIIEIVKTWHEFGGELAEFIYQGDVAAILREKSQDGPRGDSQRLIIERIEFTDELRRQIRFMDANMHQNLGGRFKRLRRLGYLQRMSRSRKGRGITPIEWKLGEKEYVPISPEERGRQAELKRLAKTSPDDIRVAPLGTQISLTDIPVAIKQARWVKRWIIEMEESIWSLPMQEYERLFCDSRMAALVDLDVRIQKALVAAGIRRVTLKPSEYLNDIDGNKCDWDELEEKRSRLGRMRVRIPKDQRKKDFHPYASLAFYAYVVQQARALPQSADLLREEALNFIKYPLITLDLNKLAKARGTLEIGYG